MGSRDFGFLTLRNIQAFQSNGNPVPPNQVLVTTGSGEGGFTNSLIISTICVSTIEVSTILIDREIASSINTNFLTVNSTTNLSTTIINNTLSLVGNTPADSEIWLNNYKSRLGTSDPYGGLYLEASTTTSIWFSNIDATAGPYAQIGQAQSAFYGSVNVASTLIASTLDARYISSYTVDIQSTLRLFDGTSTVTLDAQGSTLYVNGFPILTGGSISSVSSLFWVPRTPTDGSIYNENIGTGPNYYQIGLGTNGNQLNAIVDIANNIYTGTKNVFNISSFNNRFVIDNKNSSIQNYMTARFIDNQNNPFATSLKFEKTINFQSTTSNCELGYVDFYGTNPSQSTVRGAYILARQQNLASTFAPTDLQFITCTSSTETINMVITSQGNVGIGTTTPQSTLTVFGSCYISSGLTIDGGGAGGGGTTYGSLKIQGGIDENSILIQDGTLVTPATGIYNGYFIGNSVNFGGASTFQIGRVDGTAQQNKAIYMTQTGNVGINTFTPQFTFDVNGSMKASSYVSTNDIRMNAGDIYLNSGTIFGLSGINNSLGGGPINTVDTDIIINTGNLYIPDSGDVYFISTNTLRMNDGYISNVSEIDNTQLIGDLLLRGNLSTIGNLSVSGSIQSNTFLSTNNIQMNNGDITFSNQINIDSYPAEVNNGNINIGTAYNPIITLGSTGSNNTHIINGNLTVSGTAISRASVTYATTGTTLDSTYWGKYIFANNPNSSGYSLTLGITSVPDGTIIVIRNVASTNIVTINNVQSGPTTILSGKTTSYVYTSASGNVTAGWYAL